MRSTQLQNVISAAFTQYLLKGRNFKVTFREIGAFCLFWRNTILIFSKWRTHLPSCLQNYPCFPGCPCLQSPLLHSYLSKTAGLNNLLCFSCVIQYTDKKQGTTYRLQACSFHHNPECPYLEQRMWSQVMTWCVLQWIRSYIRNEQIHIFSKWHWASVRSRKSILPNIYSLRRPSLFRNAIKPFREVVWLMRC